MWDKNVHNFGSVKKGTTNFTEFTYNGDKEILEIEPLCNCVGFSRNENKLSVWWKVKQNPKESYQSEKIIAVTYKDNSIDDLTLKAYIEV